MSSPLDYKLHEFRATSVLSMSMSLGPHIVSSPQNVGLIVFTDELTEGRSGPKILDTASESTRLVGTVEFPSKLSTCSTIFN